MERRAQRLLAGVERRAPRRTRSRKLRFPEPAPCGKTPLTAEDLSKSYGSLEVFTDVDVAVDRGSRVVVLGLNGAGKTTLLRLLAGVEKPDTGEVIPATGCGSATTRRSTRRWTPSARCWRTCGRPRPTSPTSRCAGSSGRSCSPATTSTSPPRVLSGGEKTRLALALLVVSSANVLLLDEPTNNLDPASRAEILGALRRTGAPIVLVTHDEGAVEALSPERVILLPDGVEDSWSEELADLVALA